MATLLPPGVLQFCDANGDPLVGGSVGYYDPAAPGSPKIIWGDAAQTIQLTNPIMLDAAGRPFTGGASQSVYGVGTYLMIVKDANGVTQWTADTTSPVYTDANGNITFPASLGVAGTSNLNDVNIAGNLTVNNPASLATFGGNVLFGNPTATVTVGGALAVAGPADFNGVNIISGILFGPTGSLGSVLGLTGTIAVNANLACGGNISLPGAIVAGGSAPGSGTGASLQVPGVTPTGVWSAPLSVQAANAMQATGFFTTSDERAKTDIQDIGADEARRWVMAGRPRCFTLLDGTPGAGFLAQEEIERGRGASIRWHLNEADTYRNGPYAGYQLTKDYNFDLAYVVALLQGLVLQLEKLSDRVALLETRVERPQATVRHSSDSCC